MTRELWETIRRAIEAQKQSDQWQRDNGQYIPLPATWLNQNRWLDELRPAQDTFPFKARRPEPWET